MEVLIGVVGAVVLVIIIYFMWGHPVTKVIFIIFSLALAGFAGLLVAGWWGCIIAIVIFSIFTVPWRRN